MKMYTQSALIILSTAIHGWSTVQAPYNESIMGMNEATQPAAGTHRARTLHRAVSVTCGR